MSTDTSCVLTELESNKTFWRKRLTSDLPEFHYAASMLKLKSIREHPLKWSVVYEGGRAISKKIAVALDALGGIAGEW